MTTIYNTDWPKNFIEQKVFAKRLLDNIANTYIRKSVVTIRSDFEPTQGEWETAFVEWTGSSLPIPVGASLVWLNTRTNSCRSYTVVNNVANGMASDGTVLPVAALDYERTSLRLIGVADSEKNPKFYTGAGGKHFLCPSFSHATRDMVIRPIQNESSGRFARNGFDSLLVIYKLKAVGVVGSTDLLISIGDYQYTPPTVLGYSTMTLYSSTNNAGTTAGEDNTYYLGTMGLVTTNLSLTNSWSTGAVFIQSAGQPNVAGEQNTNYPQVQGMLLGTHLGAAFSTGNVYNIRSSFSRGEELALRQGFVNFGVSNGAVEGKYWIYGFFQGLTGDIEHDLT